MKKIIFLLLFVFISSSLFYWSSRFIQYKEISVQKVINNKVYGFLKNVFNDGELYEVSIDHDYEKEVNYKLDLKLDLALWKELSFIYQSYFTSKSLSDYNSQNQWKNGELEVNGRAFLVKIKCHGKQPDGHKSKNYMSLKLQFKNNNSPFQSNKIKIIVYKRIGSNAEVITAFSDYFKLSNIELELIKFRVNDAPYEFGFIEPVFDDKFLEGYENSSITKGFLDKSFVLNCLNVDSFSFSERLCALIDSINVSFMSPLLKNSYSKLALSIEKKRRI